MDSGRTEGPWEALFDELLEEDEPKTLEQLAEDGFINLYIEYLDTRWGVLDS